MARFTTLASRAVVLALDDVDTDQIIPARFLKVTDRAGLAEGLFADWRYAPDGSPRSDFVLNQARARGAAILVVGGNFGCGSSREHAPWALAGFGFRAVVGTSFADIFRSNALKNGLLPVAVDAAAHRSLLEQLRRDPEAELRVDLEAQALTLPDGSSVAFPIDGFSRTCLLEGVDELGYLLRFQARIAEHERRCGDAP